MILLPMGIPIAYFLETEPKTAKSCRIIKLLSLLLIFSYVTSYNRKSNGTKSVSP